MNHLGSTWYQQLEQRGAFPLVENKESAKGRRASWLLSGNKSNLDTENIWPFPYSWNANYVGSWSSRPSLGKKKCFLLFEFNSVSLLKGPQRPLYFCSSLLFLHPSRFSVSADVLLYYTGARRMYGDTSLVL